MGIWKFCKSLARPFLFCCNSLLQKGHTCSRSLQRSLRQDDALADPLPCCPLPLSSLSMDGFKLGLWVSFQGEEGRLRCGSNCSWRVHNKVSLVDHLILDKKTSSDPFHISLIRAYADYQAEWAAGD